MLFAPLLPTSARFERTSPASVWPSVPTTRAAAEHLRVLAACARVLGQRTAEDLDESTEVYETEFASLHRLLDASAKARQTASAAGLDGSSGDADEGTRDNNRGAAHFAHQSLHSSRAARTADRATSVAHGTAGILARRSLQCALCMAAFLSNGRRLPHGLPLRWVSDTGTGTEYSCTTLLVLYLNGLLTYLLLAQAQQTGCEHTCTKTSY